MDNSLKTLSLEEQKLRDESAKHGWKRVAAYVYLIVCIFDFLIAPSWIGLQREDYMEMILAVSKLDPMVQIGIINQEMKYWEPLTLIGGGIFHLAFGAILTGVAITGNKEK